MKASLKGLIFDIDTFAVHDGPGIRMAVYLKGCQMRCQWCHSPESQKPLPELIFIKDRCQLCGKCIKACKNKVHVIKGKKHIIDWDKCLACEECVKTCICNALAIKGEYIGIKEIISKAVHMKPFFAHSKGGITITGGELTLQPEFSSAFLKECKQLSIHTAIETNGVAEWGILKHVAQYADLILFDFKLYNEKEHIKWTGSSNQQILDNMQRLPKNKIIIRIPLIPGITDTEENLNHIFKFLRKIKLKNVELLPFNPNSAAKYAWLGRTFSIKGKTQAKNKLKGISNNLTG